MGFMARLCNSSDCFCFKPKHVFDSQSDILKTFKKLKIYYDPIWRLISYFNSFALLKSSSALLLTDNANNSKVC